MSNTTTPATTHRLKLRTLKLSDYDAIKSIMDRVYTIFGGAWPKSKFTAMLNRFPQGQIGVEDNGVIIAAAFAVIVDYQAFGDDHTYSEITGDASLTTHDPNGDVLYGVDVFVDPEYRDMRLGRRLYDGRKELCRRLNLKAILAGGRIPGYKDHAAKMTPEEYIEAVKVKACYDPILTFQLNNEFDVKQVIHAYLPEDKESKGYATLLEWVNHDYKAVKPKLVGQLKTQVRVGVVQWQMRTVETFEDFMQQAEFFIDALAGYNADFALFPEFFNAPLMGLGENPRDSASAIRVLASFTERTVAEMSRLALAYNINVISGSMPLIKDGTLYNVSYLCHRDGRIDEQYKLHITPSEWRYWAMKGGDQLRVFDTDVGKVGILICYDSEFPELARMQAEEGMQILFVPFWTDTKNGYQRVRYCSLARAIENECYVVIAGSVGNLPRIENVDIQYAQSAVFSPSDFPFPHDCIVAESTPNTEMTLICDLDLSKLKQLRHSGSVRNMYDRRMDLYRIHWLADDDSELQGNWSEDVSKKS
ncbi:MAG: GNAT family N-acetyltransferase [Hahellaceae bacterium]|nr:GNAT family N-acetyltransferase [Hahellaceae bacterium]